MGVSEEARSRLKPIVTKAMDEDEEWCSTTTTPTSAGSRIPTRGVECPPPPKKRKARALGSCHLVMEFFNPPDLDTVFIPRGLT